MVMAFRAYLLGCFLIFCIATPLHAEEPPKHSVIVRNPCYNPGMFCVLNVVVGLLDFYEQGHFAGLKVDFADQGLYYDSRKGPNWWSYYFEPVEIGDISNNPSEEGLGHDSIHCAFHTEFNLNRKRVHSLINQYFHLKGHLKKEVSQFSKKNFQGYHVIGVHYRGTDKSSEAPRVNYLDVYEALRKHIFDYRLKKYKIFVATDEEAFLEYMLKRFPNRVVFQEAFRSKSGAPVHLTDNHEPYQRGKEALVDAILLSGTQFLIRTSSSLSLWSTYFNPELPVLLLNTRYPGLGPPTS